MPSCGARHGLTVWQVDSLVKVFPDDAPRRSETRETLLVPRNGHGNVQLAIRAAQAITGLRVEVTGLESRGKPLRTQVRWAGYVPVGSNPPGTPPDEVIRPAPSLFPDPLREDFPLDVRPARTQSIWITVYAPPDATPAEYRGEAVFYSGDRRLTSAPFRMRVAEATVPAQPTLHVTNWFNWDAVHLRNHYKNIEPYSDSYWNLLGNIGRVMADHRQNVILTPVGSLAQPALAGGAIRYDFALFDKWVETFEKAGAIGTIEGGHLLGRQSGYQTAMVVPAYVVEGGKIIQRNLHTDDPRAEQYLNSFLSSLYAHLKEKGWAGRYIQHIHDEPHDHEAPIYNRYATIIRRNLPGVPTIDAVGLDQDISFFADVCDIWVPVLGSFDDQLDKIRDHVGKGGRAWFYTCIFPQGRYLNRFIDQPLIKVRLLHWFNFRYDFTGFLHWGGNYWGPQPFHNVQSVINDNTTLLPAGDNALVYPDPRNHTVLSSIRLEAMREGIEEYELLAALAKKDAAKARRIAAAAIPNINDYVRDPVRFRSFQKQLLDAVGGGN
jgi:hypothetical protein